MPGPRAQGRLMVAGCNWNGMWLRQRWWYLPLPHGQGQCIGQHEEWTNTAWPCMLTPSDTTHTYPSDWPVYQYAAPSLAKVLLTHQGSTSKWLDSQQLRHMECPYRLINIDSYQIDNHGALNHSMKSLIFTHDILWHAVFFAQILWTDIRKITNKQAICIG